MTPWQIAVETSCRQGSVALLREDETIRAIVLPENGRSAETLAPALETLVQEIRKSGGRLTGLSVGIGPGSFTGLRIGIAAAKGLAYGFSISVAPVDSLTAMLYRARHDFPDYSHYDVALNAYRGQVFWRREAADGAVLEPTQVIDEAQWRSLTNVSGGFVASDLKPTDHCLADWAPPSHAVPRAEEVGKLGWRQLQSGTALSPFAIKPQYLRESAAVEKLRK